MSEANDSTTPTNGGVAMSGEAAVSGEAAAGAETKPSTVTKLKAHPKVQQAIAMAKNHPLGAVATVAAAAALVEVEFAVGILTGLGATALLASRSGPEARERVIARGKKALAQARIVIAKRKKPVAPAASAAEGQAAPPPPPAE
jgi:hypothetical protein